MEFRKHVRNFSSLFIVQILNYLLPIITLPIIVRIIGPEKFGIINYLSSFVGYFVLLIGYSFDLTATRSVTANQGNQTVLNEVFNRVFFAKAVLFLVSCIIFLFLLIFFKELLRDRLVAVFTFLLCLGAFLDVSWVYMAKQDIHYTAILNLGLKVLLNVSLLIFIRERSDYIYHPMITGLAQVGIGLISLMWAARQYNLKVKLPSLREIWMVLWRDRTLFFHSFSHTIYTTLNIIILGLMRGPLEVGYYSAVWKLVILIQVLLISPATVVLFPVIGEAFTRNKADGILAIRKIIPFVLMVTAAIAVGILLFGQFAVSILYGGQFSESISIFKMLSFMPMLLALNMIFGIQAMVNLKMDRTFFKITFCGAILSVGLNYLLIGQFGAYGAAASWFATETFCAIAMFITLLRNDVRLIDYRYCKPNALKESLNLVFSKVKK